MHATDGNYSVRRFIGTKRTDRSNSVELETPSTRPQSETEISRAKLYKTRFVRVIQSPRRAVTVTRIRMHAARPCVTLGSDGRVYAMGKVFLPFFLDRIFFSFPPVPHTPAPFHQRKEHHQCYVTRRYF